MRSRVQNVPTGGIFHLPTGERYIKWPPGDACFLGKMIAGSTDPPESEEICTIVGSVWPERMPVGDIGRHIVLCEVTPGTIVQRSNSHRFLVMGPRMIYPMGYAGALDEPLAVPKPTDECLEVLPRVLYQTPV
jgi:hypothetical protein